MSLETTTAAASTAASAGASTGASTGAANPLASLSSNFTSFLSLLMTQLKNQDPTTPLDTNQFTQELVQFSSVEQQITTNSSLTTLIQATQGNEVIGATAVTGKTVTLDTDHIALQNGTGAINFTTASAEPVSVTVSDASGKEIRQASVTSAAGANTWTWNGKDDSGATVADGSYAVAVVGSTNGTSAAVPFTVTATATGVTNTNGAVALQAGALTVDFSKVQSVAGSQ